MMPSPSHAARLALPYGVLAAALLAEVAPAPLPGAASLGLAPPLLLAAVFYGAVYRPGLAPYALVFAAGIARDALIGLPPGAGAAPLLAVRWAAGWGQRLLAAQPFRAVWAAFAAAALAAAAVTWALACVGRWALLPAAPVAVSTAVAIALFPAVAAALRWAYAAAPPR
jgi:rod shape-determining protein MreD